MIAAAATRRRNAAAATDAGDEKGKAKANCSRIAAAKVSTHNATASDNNKKVVSFKTIDSQTQRIGGNSRTTTKIAAAATRRIVARGKKETTEAEASGGVATNAVTNQATDGQSLDFRNQATDGQSLDFRRLAARRRLLSSATNNHKNTTDDEGKKVRLSVAPDPPSHVNHHTAITVDDGRVKSTKKAPHAAKAKAAPKSRSSSSSSSSSSSASSASSSSSSSSCGYMSSPPLDSDDSIDGMDTTQRTINRMKNSQGSRAADVVTGAIRYTMQQEENQTTTTGDQTQTKQELVSRRLFTSMKRENAVATVDREQQVDDIQRIRGGGGNQQEAIVAGPAAALYADGTKIIKPFEGTPYKGEVISYDPKSKFYKVQYEDGDEEEMDSSEVKSFLAEEPINNNSEGISISTSTTKTSKNDEKALYDWIVNASAGNSLQFTVGSTRRKNLNKLIKNLVDTNTGLNLTQTSSDDVLTIKINSKPSSAVIVPAVESKPEPWRRSEAKEYATKELMREDSWINVEVNFGEVHGIPRSITAEEIRREEPLFRQYDSKLFNSNFMRLVGTVREDQGRGQWDQDALNKENLKYPINAILIQGYPRWNISSAKKLLEEDIKAQKHADVLPRDLRVTRQEYIDFPLPIFRHRLYAEVRKQAGDAFWVHKRNKSMMKQKVANDNENDEIATYE